MAKPVFSVAGMGLCVFGDDGETRLATDAEQEAFIAAREGGEEVSQEKLSASYTIAVADTLADLVADVCDLVTEGWIPIGAPFYVNRAMDSNGWHQALFMGERDAS